MFCFPVPKNELVDLSLRANNLPLTDADAMYEDEVARRALLDWGVLPTAPGALSIAGPAIAENDIYEVEHLKLIFYDNPFWGPYRFYFKRIFSEPRYRDLRANLEFFAQSYQTALERQRKTKFFGERGRFQACYEDYIRAQAAWVDQHLAAL
jgi:hypothetical protein